MLHITFNNSVEGGLKDIATDLRAGVKTLAVKLDVTQKRISGGFITYSLVVKSIWLVLIFSPFFLFEEWMTWGAGSIPWAMVVLVFPLVAIFYTLSTFLAVTDMERKELLRTFSLHEVASYSCLVLLLLPVGDFLLVLMLILLPLIWFIILNGLLYGTSLEPQV